MADHGTLTSSPEGETTESSGAAAIMDRRLLAAATIGDTISMQDLVSPDPAVLLGTTPQGNTCLHISCIYGHEGFCKDVVTLNLSLPLLAATNSDGETPLLAAVARGRANVASALLRLCCDQQLRDTILMRDKRGFNALHHAIHSEQRDFALELIEAEPGLSKAVNQYGDSPMFMAVVRNYEDVLEKLLEIPDSAHGGAHGHNCLHAAVTSNNAVMAKRIVEARPGLARQENEDKHTPVHLAANENMIDVLTVLLEHEPSLGYLISTDGSPLLCIAASKGNVGIAGELLRHCPDAPYCNATGSSCLHLACSSRQGEFVEFILRSPQLEHLVILPDNKGETPRQITEREMAERIVAAGDGGEKRTATNTVPVLVKEPFTSVMDQLLEAAVEGHTAEMMNLSHGDHDVLLGTTPQGNTCLHIAAIHGHELFCQEALARNLSLLAVINSDGETPLLAAVKSGRVSIASVLLTCCREANDRETILKQDKSGCNALHHAIRSGHTELALELIAAEPDLSRALNQYGESPMFIAVMRNYEDVFDELLKIPNSAHGGATSMNALHAAVRNGNSDIARKIMKTRPALAREGNNTPMQLAALGDQIDVLRVLLENDRSLGYVTGEPILIKAAYGGFVDLARELLKHCPDAPYSLKSHGWTCLHVAVKAEQMEFVKFVLGSPQLRGLINIRDLEGNTALHFAVDQRNPKIVAALLLHQDIDVTVHNNKGDTAIWKLYEDTDHANTLNWNEVYMLMLKADPQDAHYTLILHKAAVDSVIGKSRRHIKSLTYTNNTSVVAVLIATITFAAAFTLPGGYSSDPEKEGHAIMSRKFAFKTFLIFDTLAMCSSLAVTFLCIIAKWEDLEFLLYYRSSTKKLVWFAYMATTIAFATGLYTVLAPQLQWLAVAICILTSLLPILTKLLGEWPIFRMRFRLGQTFKSELLHML